MNTADSSREEELENSANGARSVRNLGLPELIAIGVGGMIGGGIFSVLGLAVDISGNAAPLAFLVGSAIALLAGYSYVKLALAYHSDGASFTYLERAYPGALWIAGITGWTVVVGYIGTLALYAFTFGAYAAHLIGQTGSNGVRTLLSIAVLGVFAGINLIGAKMMGRVEDFVVYAKILLLALLGIVGFFTIDGARFVPFVDTGVPSVFLGGALIFVAYEGFQLITNAVHETRDPDKNIPRGIYGSVVITSLIYIGITVIAVGNLAPDALKDAEEYALAVVAEPILGRIGSVLVDLAAILATSSAINATLFGSARMAREMATEALAPKVFAFRNRSGVPVDALLVIAVLAAVFAALGGLEAIAVFSSMTFLLVSIAVSVANLTLRKTTGSAIIPVTLGLLLMISAVVLMVIYVARNQPAALYLTLGIYITTGMTHVLSEKLRRRGRAAMARADER